MASSRPVSPEYDVPLAARSVQARLQAGGLVVALFQSRSRASTTPANTPDNGVYNAAAFNDNRLLVGSGTFTKPIGRFTSISTLMFSRHELDPQSGYWNVYSNLNKSYKYAYGSMAKAEEQLSWKPVPSVTMTTGGTFEHFFAIPQGADLNAPVQSRHVPGTILGTDIPDDFVKLRYANTGAFAQMQYAMTPRVTWTLGSRADYNTRWGGTFNPRLGLVVRPKDSTTLKVLYGTAFLAPSPYQAYSHYGSFYSTDGGKTYASSYWHLPNPDLKPQQKRTLEVNVLQSLSRTIQLSGSAFSSRYKHLINASDDDQAYAGTYLGWPVDYIDFAVNEGHAYTYGGSIGADYLRAFGSDRRFEAHAAVVFVDGQEWTQDETPIGLPTGAMAPVQLRFSTDLDWYRWSVAPRVSIVGAQRLLATTLQDGRRERRTLDGFATVDVNIRRRLFRSFDLFVTVENAFDRRYRTINTHAYTNPEELVGAPQNPRRVSAGFTLRIP
jgi:iron complex outermembrane receptor protein